MSVEEGQGANTPDPEIPERHRTPHPIHNLAPQSVPAATGSATLGGIALLVILAAVGAILIARRQPTRQSLLPDLRTTPSRWWRSVADAERNLAADFRHYFEK